MKHNPLRDLFDTTPREAAESYYTEGGPSIEELERRIIDFRNSLLSSSRPAKVNKAPSTGRLTFGQIMSADLQRARLLTPREQALAAHHAGGPSVDDLEARIIAYRAKTAAVPPAKEISE